MDESRTARPRGKTPKDHHAPFCTECGSELIRYEFTDDHHNGVEIDELFTLEVAAGMLVDLMQIRSNTAGDEGGSPVLRGYIARILADLHSMWTARVQTYLISADGSITHNPKEEARS
jgi:hypothetical protein